jgi:L,D-transpeptidase catalytic domain
MGVKLGRVPGAVGFFVVSVALVAGCSSTGSDVARGGGALRPAGSATAPTAAPITVPASPPTTTHPVKPATTPCTTNTRSRWVFVSLRRQHMWMCARHRVVKDTAITTGMLGQYTETPTGTYRIQGRNRNTTLTLNTGATYAVKYWIPFDAPLFGFHDSSWQDFPYGSAGYKTAGSHGCVHMPLAAIRFLYDWADVGTPVRIRA